MSKKSSPRGPKPKDAGKKIKKKISVLVQDKVEYIDYKDINLLQRFMSDRSKIRSRRVSGNDAQQQREVATAIKNAREMALLPYTKRVATQRSSRGGPGEGGGRGPSDRRGPAAAAEEAVDELEVTIEEVAADDIEITEDGE
jgi:small subunit ribosomal protein S18